MIAAAQRGAVGSIDMSSLRRKVRGRAAHRRLSRGGFWGRRRL